MIYGEVRLVLGDCREKLKDIASDSIDLVITSPPYAEQRAHVYGGVDPDHYVEWFLPISEEIKRVLKQTGTFILNIKENVVAGERHTYVLQLILAMKQQGWLWTEEFIWHKKNSYPGKWPNRFRDAWERLLQFNKSRKFNMYQEAVMVPTGEWSQKRLKNLGFNDVVRHESQVGSRFGRKMANWLNRYMAYPDNVLHMATECANRGHSAVFPEALVEWFMKLFTIEGDWVLDPFMGSGTTAQVGMRMGRNVIGIEIMKEYYDMALKRTRPAQATLFQNNAIDW